MNISVIIPTLNRSEDLKVSLLSILGQSYPVFEVIVIDQSDDNITKQLCSELNSEFIKRDIKLNYIYQSDKSLAKARNAGLSVVQGEIIAFFDDDIEL